MRWLSGEKIGETVSGLVALCSHRENSRRVVRNNRSTVGDEALGGFFVEGASLLEQAQEGAATVIEVGEPMADFCSAEGMDVEADVFAFLAVAIAFEGADLVEGDAKVRTAKGFVLVELEPVLIVKME